MPSTRSTSIRPGSGTVSRWAKNATHCSPRPRDAGDQVAGAGTSRLGGAVLGDLDPELAQLGEHVIGHRALRAGRARRLAQADEAVAQALVAHSGRRFGSELARSAPMKLRIRSEPPSRRSDSQLAALVEIDPLLRPRATIAAVGDVGVGREPAHLVDVELPGFELLVDLARSRRISPVRPE